MTEPTGQVVGSIQKTGTQPRRVIPVGMLFFIVGLVCLFLYLTRQSPVTQLFQGAYINPDEQSTIGLLQIGAAGGLAIGGLILLITLYNGFFRPQEWVDFYQDGLSYRSNSRGQEDHRGYQWNELQTYTHSVTKTYTNGIYTGDRRKLILQMTDGWRLVLDNSFKGIAKIVNSLPELTYPSLMQRTVEALNTGQSLQFGKISVTGNGLYDGSKTLMWDDVADVKVNKGVITIWERNPDGKPRRFANLSFGTMPNGYIFIGLINQLAPAMKQQKR